MRKALFFPLLLAGCGTGQPANDSAPRPPVQTATLTGLYEQGEGPRASQLCIVERGGEARFGLVTRNGEAPGCSGAGTAVRRGDSVRFAMAGEQACAFDARIEGALLFLPARVPAGCAYYCAPDVRLAGLALEKRGGAEADALRARDLVGDPLCGG